jgi:hypothetical protein
MCPLLIIALCAAPENSLVCLQKETELPVIYEDEFHIQRN